MTEPHDTPGPPEGPGVPPQNPYGSTDPYAHNPYAQPPAAQPPAAQRPYAQPPYGQPPVGGPPQVPYGGGYAPPRMPPEYYASWGDRVIATLWDFVYGLPALAVSLLGMVLIVPGLIVADQDGGDASAVLVMIGIVVMLAGFVWSLWRWVANSIIDQGRTGYTYGKRKVGIRWVSEAQGLSPGVAPGVAKYILHSFINQLCYIDYLWPLWDDKRQTLTDKILTTIVVPQPDPAGQSPLFGRRRS